MYPLIGTIKSEYEFHYLEIAEVHGYLWFVKI